MLNVLDRRGAPDPTSDLPRPDLAGDEPLTVVRDLIARVRSEGDAALIELTARFDGAQLEALRVSDEQIDRFWEATDPAVRGRCNGRSTRSPPTTATSCALRASSSTRRPG